MQGYSLLAFVLGCDFVREAVAKGTRRSLKGNIYTRLGVRPVISANIPFTFLSATLVWPEVRQAMEEASSYFVDIIELQRAVGRRLAQVSGAESGMITSGAAGAIAVATAACIAGTDPARIWQLPDTTGLKHEVIMWGGRSLFDSALRLAGGKPIVVRNLEELRSALNHNTAMLYTGYPADPDPVNAPPLKEIISICKAAAVPVFVDGAGGIPPISNLRRYPAMGVDLYAFSGGKGLRGPQCSGLLLGRKDLIEAALANNNPVEGAVCRSLKVGKEEIVGCLAAVEKWLTVDLDSLYAEQTRKLKKIATLLETVSGVTTEIDVRKGSNRFMQLTVRWDEKALGITQEECDRKLREGDPSISVLAAYNPYVLHLGEWAVDPKARKSQEHSVVVFSLGLQPGEELIVGRRLREVLKGK
ncbi:MAG: aminotransferase class V-fold PLP-dependent enzyme [Acidobacteria bacterium]|nr:aminotransferase class V-fold PLP-dependent enzyme [Acidobacteriota bacterium]